MRIYLVLSLCLGLATAAAAACEPLREIAVDGAQGLSLGLQSYPQTLDLNDHEVVLTFDDGPAETTPAVLDALKEGCVKATFFLIGEHAEAMPALVKREVAEGHSVGYHSMTHPDRTLRLMPLDAAKKDIDRGVAAVDKAGFGEAGSKPHSSFFRFPGYADSPELLDYVHGRGLAVFGSDLWASDWRTMTPEAELALVMERLEKAGKGIVLFHDSKPSTAKMLPEFLRVLKTKGYKVVHIVGGTGPTPIENAGRGWRSTTEPIVQKTLKAYAKSKPAASAAAPGSGESVR
ncbi:MAG TPA: polysaccharide deacetylase family protein [Methylocystis sp.]|nr:polysaccharide deacetylase family protein [Methylocystis sp.]